MTAMTVFFPLDTARTRLQGWLFFCGSGIRGGLLKYKGRKNSMLQKLLEDIRFIQFQLLHKWV